MARGFGDAPTTALTVAILARRLGVAPATLRTWDRRYGLGPSSHTAGAHRRYAPVDVARLIVMRRLTLDGVAPAGAAGVALAETSVTDVPGTDAPLWESPPVPPDARSTAGGMSVRRGLTRAAMTLDSQACLEIVRSHLTRRGVVATWEDLLAPVLRTIGDRWRATGQGVDVEHLLSECVLSGLRGLMHRLPAPGNTRPVLLACAEDEQHALPVHVLAAALGERHVAARTLGARVPPHALAAPSAAAGRSRCSSGPG